MNTANDCHPVRTRDRVRERGVVVQLLNRWRMQWTFGILQ